MTVLLALLLGCPKPVVSTLDPDLPEEAARPEARPPLEVLEAGADLEEPTLRALALEALVRTTSEPAGGAWGPRALWDPDGWVQRQAGLALAERAAEPETVELLKGWLARPSADPYARGAVAVALRAQADTFRSSVVEGLDAETERWRQAPLALGAGVLGHAEAIEPLQAALRRGDIALDPGFLHDLARHPDAGAVREALEEGVEWIEEELAPGYAAARLSVGDGAGEQVLRKALDAQLVGIRLEAVELVAHLEHPAATNLLKKARGHGDALVSAMAALALAARAGNPTDDLLELAESPLPEVRAAAMDATRDRLLADPGLPKRTRKQLVAAVTARLADRNADVREAAVAAVGALGLDPELARPLLTDPGARIRLRAAGILVR